MAIEQNRQRAQQEARLSWESIMDLHDNAVRFARSIIPSPLPPPQTDNGGVPPVDLQAPLSHPYVFVGEDITPRASAAAVADLGACQTWPPTEATGTSVLRPSAPDRQETSAGPALPYGSQLRQPANLSEGLLLIPSPTSAPHVEWACVECLRTHEEVCSDTRC